MDIQIMDILNSGIGYIQNKINLWVMDIHQQKMMDIHQPNNENFR